MDFFQRVGNFFSGKGWVSDDERRRKEQQVQAPVQPRPQPLQQVQQPNINRLNGLSGVNTPGLGGGTNIFSQAQQKVNPNPLQQANQATQQLNQNNQPKPLIPEKTVNDAPKVLTPQGQQDWVNKENKQIQIQNAINNPTQVLKTQVQQQQPKPAPVAIQQPQQQNRPQIAPSFPNPGRNPLFTSNQNYLTNALETVERESNKYKAEQAARNDKLDNIMRARGVSEPEIAKNRQVRIDAENRAYLSEDKARRDSNIAQMAGLATLPTRSVVSFTKGAIDGAGRTIGDSGDKLSLAVADAMYGITGDESYDKIRKYIVEQGKQRNAQYDRDLGVFKKNDTDVATAYEAGQSAQRLAQDIGTGVATGGAIPVARQFVENAADFITNANAKGKNTREMLPYAYGNAAVQAGIEKLGLDKVLSPIGKKGLTKFITGAIAEGSEEAAQQFAENAIAKHTYDPNRKYEEGVLKSGLMGAVLGGPAGMANFGAMRQTGNQPSSAMTARMNQNEATGKLEKEAIAQRQARQSSDDTSLKQAAEVNVANNQNNQLHPIQSVNVAPAVENTIPNASPALKQAVTQNMSDIQHGDVNAVATRQQTTGRLENYLIEQATQGVQNRVSQDVRYKLNDTQQSAIDYRLSQDYVASADPKAREIAEFLRKDIEQRKLDAAQARAEGKESFARQIEGMIVNQEQTLKEFEQKAQGVPSPVYRGEEIDLDNYREFNERPTTDADLETDQLIDIASEKIVDELNEALKLAGLDENIRVEHSTSRSSEANYITFYDDVNDNYFTVRIANHYVHSSGIGDLNITLSDPEIRTFADVADRVHEAFKSFINNAVNSDIKYKLNPEHEAQVRAYNEHITRLRQREEYLRGQGMSENAPAMINLRKAQEQAIYARDHIGEVDENGLKYKLSPEQETFFKDSKIRDENGNLKTVYHGTDAEFDVFNPNNTSSNKWGAGNYLAFDENAGKNYGKNVKEMYANITSPISDKQKTISFDQYDALHRRVNNGEPAYREDYDMYDNDMDLLWDITDNGQWKKYAQDIKDTTGKDGVIMDDMAITFSPNQTKYTNNLNPTDSPDMRYKRQAEAKIQEVQQSKELLARHLQLTGDENLVFNEWQNEMQKKALGYYDPKTDTINLNKLTEDTLNHELGHKILTRVENKQDLLNSIRESYGDDYLINKYGNQYGNDLNLLAEEQLADGFSDYYNGRLNGEDKVRLGTRLGIPQKVLAIYDRITEAIMGLVGKQDAIKQFYTQMETGKFRNAKQQVPGGDGRVRTMSIEAAHDGRNIVVVNNNILEGVPSKQIVPTIRKYLNENFKGNDYPLNFGNDGTGTINRNTIRKYVDPHQTFEDILIKGKMAGELPDILKVSKKYAEAADTKAHSFAKDGFEYRTSRIEIDGQQFDVTINVGLNSKGKLVYAFNNIKRIPANRSSRRFSSGDSNATIANNPQDVNSDKFQHPLQETINEMEANPKPRMTRELREAIDEFIYENIDHNLFNNNAIV